MRRRALLASLGAGLTATAGCSSLESTERPPETFAVSETTTEPTTRLQYDTVPNGISLGFEVPDRSRQEVVVTIPEDIPEYVGITIGLDGPPDRNAPATLFVRVALSESAEAPVELPAGATPPLSTYRSPLDDAGHGLFLVPRRAGVAMDDVVKRDLGCWRTRQNPFPESETTDSVVLEPGDSLAREYYVVTPWSTDRCLPTGAFEFTADAGWSFHIVSFDAEPPGRSAFADADVPDLPGFPGTRWYYDAGPELFVEPSTQSLGLPQASAAFVFHNQTWNRVAVGQRSWALYKLVDGTWYPIAPLSVVEDRTRLLPGATSTLELSFFTDPDAPPSGDRTAIGGLGEGTYAVAYPAALAVPGPNDGGTSPTAALVSLVGEPPSFDATDAVDHVETDGGVRHVYTTADDSAVATLRLREVPESDGRDGSDLQTLVLEQVLQRDALRDALVTLREAGDDVDAVVYHTDASDIEAVTAWLDPDGDGLAFWFDGTGYRASYG